MLNIKNVNISELRKICQKNKFISYKLEKSFIKYREAYYETNFENHSFIVKKGNNFCLILAFFNNNLKTLDFFGNFIEMIYEGNLENEIIYKVLENLKLIKKRLNLKKIKFITRQSLVFNSKIFNKNQIFFENNEIIINLQYSNEKILEQFKPKLRNELKIKYVDVEYKIIEKKNYQKDIMFKMMNLHKKVSGFQSRSLNTWLLNEEWILNEKAFLVQILNNKIDIGYSLYYHNEITCEYFSSCIIRDFFKKFKNLQHLSLWIAINHAKKLSKYFYIGNVVNENKGLLTEKEVSIGKFKSKFMKNPEKSVIFII